MSSVSDPEPSASIVFHDDEPSQSRKSPLQQHDHSTATTITGSVSDMKHEHDHDDDHGLHGLHGLDSTQMRNRQLSQPHLKDLDSLTHEQQTALSDMKQQVQHKYPDHEASDYTYLRFLRARKFKVPDAVEMYCKYLKWRRDYNVDEIGRNPPNELRELLTMIAPESFHKFDKFGLPAYFMKAGKANVDLMLRYVTVEDMTKTHVWGMEYSFQRAAESSARLGHNIDQFVNVVDLAGLSMGHRKLMRYIKSLAKLDQQYYPEALGKTYVINAPWVFPALWKMVSPWIDPNTRQKIHVLSGNYKQQLLERFEAKDLPKEYGGECYCGEKGCIPEYTEEETQKFLDAYEDKLGLTQTTINAGKIHEIKLKTGKYGSTIHYYFKTLKSELGYQVVFKPDERKPETIWQRHVKIEGRQPYKGYYATDKPGTVIITFDNKHSYWHAESIRQMFTVNDRTEGSSPLPIQRQLSIGSRDMFDDDEKEHGSAPASPTHQRNGSQ